MAEIQSHIPHKRQVQGFTLIEMTVVLAIMSVVSISIITGFSVALQKIQVTQTQQKMELIQKTLYQYRLAFNRLPCPADATIAVSALNFGVEAANPGVCSGGTPAANFSQTPAVGMQDVREGMVPTKTLQLPDDVAFDGWGRRFMYVVSREMTQTGAFAIITTYDTRTRISIKDTQNSVKSSIVCQALISFGPNGHGAYPRNGGSSRINAGSTNTSELDNCDCNSSAAASGVDAFFVQKDPTLNPADKLDSFDDIVIVSSRGDYMLPSSVQAQPIGANAGGGGATGSGSTNGGGGTVGGGVGHIGGGICDGGIPSCGISGGIRRCLCAL